MSVSSRFQFFFFNGFYFCCKFCIAPPLPPLPPQVDLNLTESAKALGWIVAAGPTIVPPQEAKEDEAA